MRGVLVSFGRASVVFSDGREYSSLDPVHRPLCFFISGILDFTLIPNHGSTFQSQSAGLASYPQSALMTHWFASPVMKLDRVQSECQRASQQAEERIASMELETDELRDQVKAMSSRTLEVEGDLARERTASAALAVSSCSHTGSYVSKALALRFHCTANPEDMQKSSLFSFLFFHSSA